MHPDLVAISNVWQRDAALDLLKAEHDGLTGAVTAAQAALDGARATLAAAEATLDRVKKEERANNRSLDEYVQKRDTTRRMIDTGTAPDYAAAQRQLDNCLHIVDELETKGLGLLEELDAATDAVTAGKKAVAAAEATLATAREKLAARDAPIHEESAMLAKAREGAWAELPAIYRTPYHDLRRRKRRALVNVVEGNCVQCHMRIPPQRMVEVATFKAVHTCPGCQGYLLP